MDVRVKGEWKTLYKSEILTFRDEAVSIDVEIPKGTEYIRLVTTDGGDGASADHALWANAELY